MLSIKKQLLMLALVAGCVAPVSAMDSNQDSSLIGWKAELGLTALACAGVGYYLYKSWPSRPTAKLKRTESKKPVYFATYTPPAQESLQEVVPTPEETVQLKNEIEKNGAEQEVYIQAKLEAQEAFRKHPPITQKIEIANQLDTYLEKPSQDTEDLIRAYSDMYCARVKSYDLSHAVNKLFAAKDKAALQTEYNNIKKLLGLLYY